MDVTIKAKIRKLSVAEMPVTGAFVTEPLVAVLGHPIGGNPSQFALERAFESLGLDWRVISFDVKADDLSVALSGLDVLGIRGVLLGRELATAAGQWFDQKSDHKMKPSDEDEPKLHASSADCFYRIAPTAAAPSRLCCLDAQSGWVANRIETHFGKPEADMPAQVCVIGETTLQLDRLMGEKRSDVNVVRLCDESEQFCPEAIGGSSIFLIGEQKPRANLLDWDDWLLSPAESLVIDLTDGYTMLDLLSESGRTVISSQQCHAGFLSDCIAKWLGQRPAIEVIQDAIEEYMGV